MQGAIISLISTAKWNKNRQAPGLWVRSRSSLQQATIGRGSFSELANCFSLWESALNCAHEF